MTSVVTPAPAHQSRRSLSWPAAAKLISVQVSRKVRLAGFTAHRPGTLRLQFLAPHDDASAE